MWNSKDGIHYTKSRVVVACMHFADVVVLVGEWWERINGKLEWWRESMNLHGFYLSRCKTKFMECKFSVLTLGWSCKWRIGDYTIPQVAQFRYSGSILQSNMEEWFKCNLWSKCVAQSSKENFIAQL